MTILDIDKWQEIFSTMRKNKLRTILTGFSVAWGIFMLIVLLGSGKGLQNGVQQEFKKDATNTIWLFPGRTTIPHKGMKPGREIKLTNTDYEIVKRETPHVDKISSRFYFWEDKNISYKNEYGNFEIHCVHPDYKYLENATILEGRFLNNIDIQNKRKMVAIGKPVKEALFKDKNPIGEYILIAGIPFRVVGVFTDVNEQDENRVYLPLSTAQMVFNGGNNIHRLAVMTDANTEESNEMVEKMRTELANRHIFDVKDDRALFIWNAVEEFAKFQSLFKGINLFVWVIGIFTIIAGIVGVSNIMMIVVKERTREIGVRKAIGATPWSIIGLVVTEAILITSVAGYIGLLLGIFVLETVAGFVPENPFFSNPEIDLNVALAATLVLIVTGALAGFFPALKAAQIKPIAALRDE